MLLFVLCWDLDIENHILADRKVVHLDNFHLVVQNHLVVVFLPYFVHDFLENFMVYFLCLYFFDHLYAIGQLNNSMLYYTIRRSMFIFLFGLYDDRFQLS